MKKLYFCLIAVVLASLVAGGIIIRRSEQKTPAADYTQNSTENTEAGNDIAEETEPKTEEPADKNDIIDDLEKYCAGKKSLDESYMVCYFQINSDSGIGVCLYQPEGGAGSVYCKIATTLDYGVTWEKKDGMFVFLNGPTEFALNGNRLVVFNSSDINFSAKVDVYEIDENGELVSLESEIEVPSLERLGFFGRRYRYVYPEKLYFDDGSTVIAWKFYQETRYSRPYIMDKEYECGDKIIVIAKYDSEQNETVLFSDDGVFEEILDYHAELHPAEDE